MEKAIIYDFDKTIYSKETSISFLIFFLKRRPQYILKFIFSLILIIFNIKNLSKVKSLFYSVLKDKNIDNMVVDFWEKEMKNIYPYFWNEIKENKKQNCKLILISASPNFLIEYIGYKLGFDIVISTNFDNKMNMIGKNCKGVQKVNRLNEFGNFDVLIFYSDSLSDLPLFNLAKKCYTIKKGNKIEGIPKESKWIDNWL